MPLSIISFKNVTFTYQKEADTQIRSCSFELNEGDRMAIKGESGTGKTTLFRLIHGFEQPESGAIYYKGDELTIPVIKNLRKESAWLPQDLNLGKGQVREVLSYPFEFSANHAKVTQSIEFESTFKELGLEKELLDKDFSDLSTGQRQRAGIALCLLLDKPLMMLDEPTSALDRASKQKVVELLFDNSGRTILSTSHDLFWIEQCNKVIEL
ncbi:ATP-binding cassette domain-containing protein [Balneolaceae bacterium YR4-1]|uniref:ATP-binding cassette domain-containing protein n=1 Tax=Halalkalibaculum roseum TaxID=2709311 RepID=A0A6M1STQ6_9BACT|nr:ABC transporter ATP-binding protein [Halalkalibaculum roseum]NGP75526.1 ATP-binding cassette domain-containing protein [Halalkalibaculum roseum]